ncbi:MAG: PQQ-binding-like beta-propeller repeat protein, partial [Mycobacterium sp.]|nr:PQQ-binding-like beta-propeller repeat protein [Mycobacterium sp.]
MSVRRRVLVAVAALGLAAYGNASALASTQNTTTASPSASGTTTQANAMDAKAHAGDWTTYHRTNARDGNASDLAPMSQLSVDWHAQLDGAVYGQPLVVNHRIFAATENDTIYALNQDTGAVLWSMHVGQPEPQADLPCGDIDPLGITSTMVYDPATNRLFAVAETTGGHHTMVGVNADTGNLEVSAPAEPPEGDFKAHQQRAALNLLDGRVNIAYGGLAGDCASYIGSVVSLTTKGTDKLSFAVPTTREGGIWATGGAVVDKDRLLYPVGNGESVTGYDGSDSVTALSPRLRPVDFFAPSTWADD